MIAWNNAIIIFLGLHDDELYSANDISTHPGSQKLPAVSAVYLRAPCFSLSAALYMAQYATPSIHSGSGQRDLDDTNGVTVADTMEESSRGIHLEPSRL